MKLEQVLNHFDGRQNGTYYSMDWTRDCKIKQSAKKQGIVITKHSKAVLQYKVKYDNKATVQEKRKNGTLPKENQGLPWGYWYNDFIIAKDNKDGTTDFYLRGGIIENSRIESEYEINGEKTTYQEIEPLLLASEKPKKGEKPDVINVKIDNINYIK